MHGQLCQDTDGCGVEADFLARFTQGSGGRVTVARVDLAAGKGDYFLFSGPGWCCRCEARCRQDDSVVENADQHRGRFELGPRAGPHRGSGHNRRTGTRGRCRQGPRSAGSRSIRRPIAVYPRRGPSSLEAQRFGVDYVMRSRRTGNLRLTRPSVGLHVADCRGRVDRQRGAHPLGRAGAAELDRQGVETRGHSSWNRRQQKVGRRNAGADQLQRLGGVEQDVRATPVLALVLVRRSVAAISPHLRPSRLLP